MASTAGPFCWRNRSRICARKAVQFSELTFDSKPAASSAHMVANMASLSSTLTAFCGAGCSRSELAGASGLRGACLCGCAGACGVLCAVVGNATVAHSPKSAVSRRALIIPVAAAPIRASHFLFSAFGVSQHGRKHLGGQCPLTMLRLPFNLPLP